jgi:hypothetical protein
MGLLGIQQLTAGIRMAWLVIVGAIIVTLCRGMQDGPTDLRIAR